MSENDKYDADEDGEFMPFAFDGFNTTKQLERRIASLEKRVALLEKQSNNSNLTKNQSDQP